MFDVANKRGRLQELDQEASSPDFWNDPEKAQAVLQQRSELTDLLGDLEWSDARLTDCSVFLELYDESKDEELLVECSNELDGVEERLQALE
ncbi:MAG: PCRF domain-containing protein, partial [Bdellovibrionales bacterium]|nr:PCRF domain-containing protein [Bdellovibrionales bacterium]